MRWFVIFCSSLCIAQLALAADGTAVVDTLRCEYRKNPSGIESAQPRLSWEVKDTTRGAKQTAYQVLVAISRQVLDANQGDLWDSGKVPSDAMFNITYAGKPIPSWQTCFWKVRTWDQNDRASDWSQPASWIMAVKEENWKAAKWIGINETERPVPTGTEDPATRRLAARQLRCEFDAHAKPGHALKNAKVAICGLGLSELYLNGKKVGDEVLSPPLNEYNKRATYVVYDVTDMLKDGRNAIGVWLGNGRYWAMRRIDPAPMRTFGPPKVRLVLTATYGSKDGDDVQTIITDEQWKATDQGPIVANNEYDGEEYDARKEQNGWAEPGYQDASWKSADVLPAPSEKLSAPMSPPIRVTGTRKSIAKTNPKPGVYIFDLGQNMVGWCRLHVKGPAGTAVHLRHAETLQPDGNLYVANLRHAQCADTYTLKGDGDETYEPRFTYHGFRYVEVTGYPGEPANDAIEGCIVNDDLEQAGDFACSNELINRLHTNALWGIRGNYRSIPTDCPQRDERHGWLGDRAMGCHGEMQLFNVAAFYEKWLTDIADAQQPDGTVSDVCPAYWAFYNDNVTWAGTIAMLPVELLDQYADQRLIASHYPAMRAWVEHMLKYMADDRMPRDTYGDWCVPPHDPKIIHSTDPAQRTNGELIGTSYFCHILQLMTRYATLVGKPDDAARYTAMAERMKASFNKRFYNASTGQYDNGTQTSSILALTFGLTPDDQSGGVFNQLINKIESESKSHVGTGLVGVQNLMRVLSNNGRPDLALKILTQKDYPSWGYMAAEGATTVWELWNGNTADPAMNSGNHVMLIGDSLPWMYEYLAGIRPDPSAPGYRRMILKPLPLAGIDWAKAWRQTMAGRIESQWRRENGQLTWNVAIPVGATATVYVPAKDAAKITEGGKPVNESVGLKFLRQAPDAAIYEAQPGQYKFQVLGDLP
jgi:alpha-L-rhamnosidase